MLGGVIMDIQIKWTRDTASNPLHSLCNTGKAVSASKYKYGDICYYHRGVPLSKSFINSQVFKDMLLNNKEFLRTQLGIEVKDVHEDISKDLGTIEETATQQYKDPKDMTYKELKEYASGLGLEFKGNISKSDLLALISKEG